MRHGKKIPVNIPTITHKISVGDVVHRHLQDGDYVVLNRQLPFTPQACKLLKSASETIIL